MTQTTLKQKGQKGLFFGVYRWGFLW